MPAPDFVIALRAGVGQGLLWLPGSSAVVFRGEPGAEEILLVKRADDGEWSPVSGIVDPGEQPGEAVVREVLEEAGVVAEVERLVWVSVTDVVTYDNGDRSQYLDHTFRCRWISGEPYPADGENTEARFFRLDELPELHKVHADRVAVAVANRPETVLGPLPR